MAPFTPILLHADNPGPLTGDGNNTFLLIGANGAAVLIDAGQGRPAHLDLLRQHLGQQQARLEQVLVTHAHSDHAAGAAAIREAYPHVRFRKQRWPGQDERFAVDWQSLPDGTSIDLGGDTLVALHTPGHSPDHMAFWHEGSGTLFAGDLVMATGTVLIEASRGGDLSAYLASLTRIQALRPRRVLPAHGPAIDEPDRLLRRCLQRRRAREAQVLKALASGPRTVQAMAESIYHGLDPDLMPAAHETVRAHLEKLRREGRAFVRDDQWSADGAP